MKGASIPTDFCLVCDEIMPEKSVHVLVKTGSNFNLYEGEETYDIQLIGSDEFDEDDNEWACSEVYSSEEDICYIDIDDELENWEVALDKIIECIKKYLECGKYSGVLKSVSAVGAGFVDGDIEIVFNKN